MELSKEYIKGFNSGYLLRKHKPILIKNLEPGLKGNSPYVTGIKDGSKEYEKELDRKLERLHAKSHSKERSQDLGLGI